MKVKFCHYTSLAHGGKVPRKIKKALIGKKMGSRNLKLLIKSIRFINPNRVTMYEPALIEPYAFCPCCGCKESFSTGNMTSYPEHWENWYCLRCKEMVGEVDNSPFRHVLEWNFLD